MASATLLNVFICIECSVVNTLGCFLSIAQPNPHIWTGVDNGDDDDVDDDLLLVWHVRISDEIFIVCDIRWLWITAEYKLLPGSSDT